MEEESLTDIIKITPLLLGKYVKRPPLTEKLLRKPPFRFLHDIITSVLKNTGFFSGLFEEGELISDNVKDRESKISFLNKVITVICTATGKPLSVKPSKIIAGQEPEKTNELLQCLAVALDNKISSDEAVKSFKESVKLKTASEKKTKDLTKLVKKSTDTRKLSSKSDNKSIKSDKTLNATKVRERENTNIKKESPPKKSLQPSKGIKKFPEKLKSTNRNDITLTNNSNQNTNDESLQSYESAEHGDENLELTLDNLSLHLQDDKNGTVDINIDCNAINNEYTLSQETSKLDDVEHEHKKESNKIEHIIFKDDINTGNGALVELEHHENKYEITDKNTNSSNEQQESIIIQKIELDRFQKDAVISNSNEHIKLTHEPKVTDVSHVKRPSSVRPSSSRPGAPRIREKHDNIIVTDTENLIGGKVNIIAENGSNEEEDETSIIIIDNTDTLRTTTEEKDQLRILSHDHGHLVAQILDAQKEFTQTSGKTEIEWQFGAQKARDVINQEIEQIRFNVQALSRVANPLGKLLDHIQEDVEVMRQELHIWTTSYNNASKELMKQKMANEEYLLPLHARIKQLDLDISEKHDKINDLKIVIHKNASRIDKLLASGNVQ